MYDDAADDDYREGYAVGYADGAKAAGRFWLVAGAVLTTIVLAALV